MRWLEYYGQRALFCDVRNSIRDVIDEIKNVRAPVYLIEDEAIAAVIEDCDLLVREHSYRDSPFLIGQLVTNATRAFFMTQREIPLVEEILSGPLPFVKLPCRGKENVRVFLTKKLKRLLAEDALHYQSDDAESSAETQLNRQLV